MYELCRHLCELRHPASHVAAQGIRVLSGIDGVQHEVPLGDAAVTALLPEARVDGRVGVDKCVVVPLEALLPGDVKVVNQEACGHMAEVVVDVALPPQLPHRRVDQGEASAALLPPPELSRRARPSLILVLQALRPCRHVRPAVQFSVAQVAPQQSPHEAVAQVRRGAHGLEVASPRRDFAEPEVWGQQGRVGLIASVPVGPLVRLDALDKLAKSAQSSVFARPPKRPHLRRPIVVVVLQPNPSWRTLRRAASGEAPAPGAVVSQVFDRQRDRPDFRRA
mmetsp:Transcript_26223/g.75234  ORF Transcript_26223/g.75234 Transcript_26223/m.75234 type:complete len:279 (-) Transcript_26223:397-1233(-)